MLGSVRGVDGETQEHYFTAEPAAPGGRRTHEVWLAGRRVLVQTAGGVFSPERVDTGTGVLLQEAPAPPGTGTFLDLGCGWGPLALTLGLVSPEALVYAVDVNERAIDLTRANAASLSLTGVVACRPEEVPDDVHLDVIWSNPPIRVGKSALHAMLAHWLPRLHPGGVAYLVVQKNLGADSLQRWLGHAMPELTCSRHAISRGFRVLQVSREVSRAG